MVLEEEENALLWKYAETSSSSSPPPPKKPPAAVDDEVAFDLMGEDEKMALERAATSVTAATRKAVAAAAKAATPAAQVKEEGSWGARGVEECKGQGKGKRQKREQQQQQQRPVAAAATTRAVTPTFGAVVLPVAVFSSPAPSSSSSPSALPSSSPPQHAWGPCFGIVAQTAAPTTPSPSASASATHFPPTITITAAAAAAACPAPDAVAAAVAAACAVLGKRRRPLLPGSEGQEEASASEDSVVEAELRSLSPETDPATRALMSPWLLLDGSPSFGAKGGPRVPSVAPEDLVAGAEELRKRLRCVLLNVHAIIAQLGGFSAWTYIHSLTDLRPPRRQGGGGPDARGAGGDAAALEPIIRDVGVGLR